MYVKFEHRITAHFQKHPRKLSLCTLTLLIHVLTTSGEDTLPNVYVEVMLNTLHVNYAGVAVAVSPPCLILRVKSGIFGQTAKFGQPPCLFHSSVIGIENKLTKQTVKLLMRRLIRGRFIWISTVGKCVSEFS